MNLTRRDWQRMASAVGLVLVLGWLVGRGSCGGEIAEATVRFRLGERAGEVRWLRAELHRGDDPEVLAYWERTFDERGADPVAGLWPLRADSAVYRLEVEVRTAAGSRRSSRAVEIRDGASITVDLGDVLPAAR